MLFAVTATNFGVGALGELLRALVREFMLQPVSETYSMVSRTLCTNDEGRNPRQRIVVKSPGCDGSGGS